MQKKSTRVLSLVLSIAMVITMMTGVASAVSYKDIYNGHWAQNYINYLSDKEVFEGYKDGTFKPSQTVTTAELMAVISRTFGLTATSSISYADVKSTDWFYPYVSQAAAQGYIITNGSYVYPNQALTREKAVAMIARYLGLESTSTGYYRFTDSNKINSAYVGYVNAAVAAGIINGYTDGSFKPQQAISRAEIAKIIYTMLGGNIIRESVSGASSNGACVTKGYVTVSNSNIGGTVYVTEGATGKVTFSNSVITKLVVRGNTSVSLVNTKVGELVLDSSSGTAYVEASGSTTVQTTTAEATATLTDSTTLGGAFGKVNADMPTGGELTLNGTFDEVSVLGAYNYLDIPAASKVTELNVSSNANNARITGKGTITYITVSATGCVTEQMPYQYVIANNLKATFAGSIYTGSGTLTVNNTGFVNGYPYVSAAHYSNTYDRATVTVKTAVAGTIYMVAYPTSIPDSNFTASAIVNHASYSSTYYGKSASLEANTEYQLTLNVPCGTNYALAAVFVPAGISSTACTPVYAEITVGASNSMGEGSDAVSGYLVNPVITKYTAPSNAGPFGATVAGSVTVYAQTTGAGTLYVLPYNSATGAPDASTVISNGQAGVLTGYAGSYSVSVTTSVGGGCNMVAVLFVPKTGSIGTVVYGTLRQGGSIGSTASGSTATYVPSSVTTETSSLTISFDQAMYYNSALLYNYSDSTIKSLFSVSSSKGAFTDYTATVSGGSSTVTLTPVTGKTWPSSFTVTIGSELVNIYGQPVADRSFSVTVGSGITAGKLSATVANNGSTLPVGSTIASGSTVALASGKTSVLVEISVPAGHILYSGDSRVPVLSNASGRTSATLNVTCVAGKYEYYTTYNGNINSILQFTVGTASASPIDVTVAPGTYTVENAGAADVTFTYSGNNNYVWQWEVTLNGRTVNSGTANAGTVDFGTLVNRIENGTYTITLSAKNASTGALIMYAEDTITVGAAVTPVIPTMPTLSLTETGTKQVQVVVNGTVPEGYAVAFVVNGDISTTGIQENGIRGFDFATGTINNTANSTSTAGDKTIVVYACIVDANGQVVSGTATGSITLTNVAPQ